MEPSRLDEIIEGVLRRRPGLRKELSHREVFSRWERIAGKALARHVAPLEFRGHTLLLGARGSAWAQELEAFREEILQRAAQEVGVGVVREIRVRVVGDLPGRKAEEGPSATNSSDADGSRPGPRRRDDRSAEEILAEIRRAHQRRKESRRAAGWPRCTDCGERFPPELTPDCAPEQPVCPTCLRKDLQRRETLVIRLVEELPWMGTQELHRESGLDEDQCRQLRGERMEFWRARIRDSIARVDSGREILGDYRKRIMQLLMAETGAARPRTGRTDVENICGTDAARLFFDGGAGEER